jgi:carboxypeptidase PM20D1
VSHQDPVDDDPELFVRFGLYLEATYPRVHQRLALQAFDGGSRLYLWKGQDPKAAPLVLLAHMDVVPVEDGTEGKWEHPPFSGTISDGYIWGRGSMDDKLGVIATLEAVDSLLGEGFVPKQDVYLAFGHDEEVGGQRGAAVLAKELEVACAAKGVRPGLILDEGGVVVEGVLPGIEEPVALVGIAEKGYLSVRLSVELEGGHSSMPASEGSIGVLAGALTRVQAEPMPRRLEAAPRAMLERLAPAADLGTRIVARNLWLFEPLLLGAMSQTPGPAASIRTTTALTIVSAGTKDNVLPSLAEATLNLRVLPGDDEASIHAHLRRVIDDDRVHVETLSNWGSSPTSDPNSQAFAEVEGAIEDAFGVRLVAPYLVVGGTDARHYAALSDYVFRFLPVHFQGEDAKRMHGTNERISVTDAKRAVWFYRRVIERVTRN